MRPSYARTCRASCACRYTARVTVIRPKSEYRLWNASPEPSEGQSRRRVTTGQRWYQVPRPSRTSTTTVTAWFTVSVTLPVMLTVNRFFRPRRDMGLHLPHPLRHRAGDVPDSVESQGCFLDGPTRERQVVVLLFVFFVCGFCVCC